MAFQPTYLPPGASDARMDIGEILARNRNTESTDDCIHGHRRHKGPETGLLSRTVIQSPNIQWVVPARIRHADKNDVVFVGNNYIQIMELALGGDSRHLEGVVTKTDFDSNIVGAKVISARPDIGLEDHIKLGAQSQDEDLVMIEGVSDQSLPPDILVLVLSSNELLFTYAVESAHGDIEFILSRRALPSDVSSLEEYGRNICVDPRSRAISISATRRFFGIFSMKHPSLLQLEMKEGRVNPIAEERFLRIDGDILMMDFLHPTDHDNDRALLLLLVSSHGETHIMCYDWNTTEGLISMSSKVIGQKLPLDCALPSLLIPLKRTTSFLLVGPSCMLMYTNVLGPDDEGSPVRQPMHNPDGEDPPGGRIWTFWARPIRNARRFDDIFLCREDGNTLYVEIPSGGGLPRTTHSGQLGCKVDTAFASIDGGYQAGDLLVAVGSMSGGGLFVADPRQPPRCVQHIANWAPILDSTVIAARNPLSSGNEKLEVASIPGDRIFACSSAGGGRGSLTELRYGIEAQIGLMIDPGEASSITNIWAIPDINSGATLLLLSDPLSSLLVCVPVDSEEPYGLDAESSGLDLSEPTLAAATTADGLTIQVTNSSINLCVSRNKALMRSSKCRSLTDRIIVASVNGKLSLVATAVRNGDDVRVEIWRIITDGDTPQCNLVGKPLKLSHEPVCLLVAGFGSHNCLFVGTGDGGVFGGWIHDTDSINLCPLAVDFPIGNGGSRACESMSVISTQDQCSPRYTIFCGMRTGSLVAFDIKVLSGTTAPELKQVASHKFGDTPVRIRGYECNAPFAIASCGSGLWRLSAIESHSPRQYGIHHVWITDQNNPAYKQSSVDVFNCVEGQNYARPGGLEGSLVCVTQKQLLACSLDPTPKPVSRHIQLPGSPRRLVYSEYLKRLVVGYEARQIEVDDLCRKLTVRPSIVFVDPDGESAIASSSSSSLSDVGMDTESSDSTGLFPQSRTPTGAAGEKITTILDWQFTQESRVYHMIVVGTNHPHAEKDGRVIYITARPSATVPGQIDSSVKFVHAYKGPVRAIAAYGSSSLVIAAGKEISLQTLDAPAKRWRKFPTYKVESIPVSVTVREPYIYVLTSKHSLCVLKVGENCPSLYAQDGVDRAGLNHVNLDDESRIVMTSSHGGAIVGITDIRITPEEKLMQPVFAAHMPLSVLRLSRSSKRNQSATSQVTNYGTTIDGAVYRFTTLSETEWRLLRFVQNLCVADPVLCPFAKRRRIALNDLESPNSSRPESMHVNGDILDRLAHRGVAYLEKLVTSETIGGRQLPTAVLQGVAGGSPSGNRSIGKVQKFNEYSELIVGDVPNRYAAVMLWMENMLQVDL